MVIHNRKHDILQAAELVKHTGIYVAKDGDYVEGFAHKPVGTIGYESHVEPIVDTRTVDLEPANAWLTMNRYNAVILNSRNLLIADVDFGDERLNQFAGAADEDEVIDTLNSLRRLDEAFAHENLHLSGESYRVYRTRKGCRVICTSSCWPQGAYPADLLLRFLKADRQYVSLCRKQKSYRARLTPKPWRCSGEPTHVCEVVAEIGPRNIHPELAEQLAIHDELTLPESHVDSVLA